MDITYHYPPELFQLMVDTIPRLCRSKNDVLLFLRGAGVDRSLLSDLEKTVETDRRSINKFEIVRTVLQRLNERGEGSLRERREVLKRVVQFEDFSTCWPNDVLEAKGLVAEIRKVVDTKDSFTRMKQERDAERREHQRRRDEEIRTRKKRKAELQEVRTDLAKLFAETDKQARGRAAEDVLNRLFSAHDILIRESFRRNSEVTGRVLEQIDGVIELDGEIYLVEVKWLSDSVDVNDVSRHLVRVFSRGSSRGIFISVSNYTEAAIETCREALGKAVVVLGLMEEVVYILEAEKDLKDVLKSKIHAAIVDKNPLAIFRN